MERHEFSALIGRLEREADDNPQIYAVKVGVLAALGYVTIIAVGGAILAFCWYTFHPLFSGGRFRWHLALACSVALFTLFAMLRALWVKLGEPDGMRVSREQAPGLYAMIDDIARRLGGVPVHSVSVSSDFNACIVQTPRWGVFGNYRNHLEIGLPLAMALSIEELKAVIAHEMGHLSAAHGKFSAWIYRQRVTWHALEGKFRDPANIFDQVLGAFYGWYAPYFYAYSFVLARNHEYAADRAAARATSAAAIGSALTKLELIGRFLSEVFWKRLYDQIERVPDPSFQPHSLMPRAFQSAQKQWARADWLQDSLRRYAADDDTHPSLAERLAALDLEPELPAQPTERSALALFHPSTPVFVKHFDEQWRKDEAPRWRKRHEQIAEAKAKLELIGEMAPTQLSDPELWDKATLLLEIDREDDAIEALNVLILRRGRYAKAHLLLGHLLLNRNEDAGLQHLTAAMQIDQELAEEAGRAGFVYLMRRGREAEAKRFWAKAQGTAAA